VVDGGSAVSELEDPPPLVMVKVGEMLSALPITKSNVRLASWEEDMIYELTYRK
jgi:hypothetical protein